jgi:hypothetical protein
VDSYGGGAEGRRNVGHKHYLSNASVSMNLEPNYGTVDIAFSVMTGDTMCASLVSDFSAILEKQDGAADTLMAMGVAVAKVDDDD